MKNIKTEQFFPESAIILIILAGLFLPVLLIFPVKFAGHSEIIEETAKALVVLFLILKLPGNKLKVLAGIGFGFLFGLSESFFYLNNVFQVGNFNIFWQRFLWTVPMHIITVLIMVIAGLIKNWALIFGLAGAITLHALFNNIAVKLLMR